MDVKKLRENHGVTQTQLAEQTGIPRDRIAKWEQGKGSPKAADAEVLAKYFNGKWEDIHVFNSKTDDLTGQGETKTETYLEKRRTKKNNANLFLAPLVPVKAQAGYIRANDQAVYMDTLEKYALPPGVDPMAAIWAYWEIEGDSMETTFYSGDYILATQVPRMDWDQLRNFYIYVIVTEEKVLIKRLYAKNGIEWVLISDNDKQYKQQLLPVEYVRQVWVFRRHIDSKAPPPRKFEIEV